MENERADTSSETREINRNEAYDSTSVQQLCQGEKEIQLMTKCLRSCVDASSKLSLLYSVYPCAVKRELLQATLNLHCSYPAFRNINTEN